MTQGVVNDQIILAYQASANDVAISTANAIAAAPCQKRQRAGRVS
jgi:hypothetical protein